ncbi:MAG: hypothetical protein WAU69_12375, partial [Solirubrobacteraceae bacterium]
MVLGIKAVCLAFIAAIALSAVAASSASAIPLIRFSAEGAFTGKSGKAVWETKKGTKIECEQGTAKGNVTSLDRAETLIEFEKCKGPSGTTCTITEAAKEVGTSGNIHVLAAVLLGSDEAPPNDNPAVLITTENKAEEKANVTFLCQVFGIGSEITVRGSVIGLAKNATVKGKPGITLSFAKTSEAGVQQDKKFWDESETDAEDSLEMEAKGVESFAFEGSSEEVSAELESTNNIQILPRTSGRPLIHFTAEGSFTGRGGIVAIQTKKGLDIDCEEDTIKGNVTGLNEAHVLAELEKCTAPAGRTCTTTEAGSEVGTIGHVHVLASVLLGSDTAPPLDLPAVLVAT